MTIPMVWDQNTWMHTSIFFGVIIFCVALVMIKMRKTKITTKTKRIIMISFVPIIIIIFALIAFAPRALELSEQKINIKNTWERQQYLWQKLSM